MPHWYAYNPNAGYNDRTIYNLSNISDATITVTVTLYDYFGNIVQDGDDSISTGTFRSYNVSNWDYNPTGASVSFDIAPKATSVVYVNPTSAASGFGTISWT